MAEPSYVFVELFIF